MMYRLDRFRSSSATAGKYFRIALISMIFFTFPNNQYYFLLLRTHWCCAHIHTSVIWLYVFSPILSAWLFPFLLIYRPAKIASLESILSGLFSRWFYHLRHTTLSTPSSKLQTSGQGTASPFTTASGRFSTSLRGIHPSAISASISSPQSFKSHTNSVVEVELSDISPYLRAKVWTMMRQNRTEMKWSLILCKFLRNQQYFINRLFSLT